MNNPFDYVPDAECEVAFRKLTEHLDNLRVSGKPEDLNFCRELDAGKMLGVLIAEDSMGVHHSLYAFSGQLGVHGFYYDGFVGPVFDYLDPEGYFKITERDISCQNRAISRFENETLARLKSDYERETRRLDAEVSEFKESCRLSKSRRDALRKNGDLEESELAAMIRQSQFEKAELHRLKKKVAADLVPYVTQLEEARSQLDRLKSKRHADSEALQIWLFANFKLLNARGESKTLSDIFAETSTKVPPSGAGECCAPKLMQAAYLKGWKPLKIAEYWYGKPKGGEVRRHGEHYPACRGKCLPVLGWMLQGLEITPPLEEDQCTSVTPAPEIIYENQWFCVINKPSGMLSVPGKRGGVSAQQWLADRYGSGQYVKMVHRLDQDTSGLLIAALDPDTYKIMQSLFAMRKVEKTYVADLEGDFELAGLPRSGRIALPLSPDWFDRPRQRVDYAEGKEAVTDYEFTEAAHGCSRVKFYPHTGRTHQLRVHAASESGLGMPIVGDRLYGKGLGRGATRLHLHAQKIVFTFPVDNRIYSFESPLPFGRVRDNC